jgi:hypothetical protein
MPAAVIEINAVAVTSSTLPLNTPVQLSNQDIGGETTYAWTILSQPDGSPVDVLSNPAIENPVFTPTREGSYLLRLVVNAGGGVNEKIGYAVVGVVMLRTQLRMPAGGEILQYNTVVGWAFAVNKWLEMLDKLRGDSNVVICTATAAMGLGSIVRYASATDIIKPGLYGQETVMRAALATATTVAAVTGELGVVIAVCDGTSIGAGKLILARRFGMSEIRPSGTPTVGDFVLIDNLGGPSLLYTATVPRIVGRVIEVSGGFYTWVIEPGHILERRPTSALEFEIWSGSSWTTIGGGAGASGPAFNTTSGSAAGLHAPLKVNQGEVLYAVTLDIDQDTVSTITALLSRGNYVAGVTQSDAMVSPASATPQIWNIVPTGALVLPAELTADNAFWLFISTTGAGNKIVSGATAFVRPASP